MRYNHLDIVCLDSNIYTIKNTINHKYIKMGNRETKYLLQCIGYEGQEIDLKDIPDLVTEEQELMHQKFEEWGFLSEEDSQIVDNKKFDITRIKVCEINPDDYLNKVPIWLQNMFSKRGAFLVMVLTIVAVVLMCKNPEQVYMAATDSFHFSIPQYIIFYFMMISTTMLHEMGHAICCCRHGGKISSMGVMLFFLIPCFFCDVSDIYMFKDRKKSFGVAISGIMINYTMGTIACLAYFAFNTNGVYLPLLMFYYFANIGFLVFNLIPFVKLDGYWVATALLEVDNLMDKSILTFLTGVISPKKLKDIKCGAFKKSMLFLYGFSAIIFRPIFWIISVYSVCEFLSSRHMDWCCGVVVGFVFVMVVKDIATLLMKYIEMYRNQKQRVMGMI